MIIQSSVSDFLAGCQIGDSLCWWGGSWLSHAIESQTGDGPSHVSMVRRIDARTPAGIVLVESTEVATPHRFIGVVERSVGEEIDEYNQEHGQGVWLPLAARYRTADYNWDDWAAWMDSRIGDSYSYAQMILEAYDELVVSHHIPGLDIIAADFARGNWHQEFCSQLWCMGKQHIKVLSASRIPGLTAPKNSWQAAIYDTAARQFAGAPLTLPNDLSYNSVAP
jgi:hypothetical protein